VAVVTPLSALVFIPTAVDRRPFDVSGGARTTQASHSVAACSVIATILQPIKVDIVCITFVDILAPWLRKASVAKKASGAILNIETTHYIFSTNLVKLVADSVATVVRCLEPIGETVVWEQVDWEIVSIETLVIATGLPT